MQRWFTEYYSVDSVTATDMTNLNKVKKILSFEFSIYMDRETIVGTLFLTALSQDLCYKEYGVLTYFLVVIQLLLIPYYEHKVYYMSFKMLH